MTTYTYQKVTLNRVSGWIATRRIAGVHAGKQFGRTQKTAREAFDVAEEIAYMYAADAKARFGY